MNVTRVFHNHTLEIITDTSLLERKDCKYEQQYEDEYYNRMKSILNISALPSIINGIIVIYSLSYCKICLRIGIHDNNICKICDTLCNRLGKNPFCFHPDYLCHRRSFVEFIIDNNEEIYMTSTCHIHTSIDKYTYAKNKGHNVGVGIRWMNNIKQLLFIPSQQTDIITLNNLKMFKCIKQKITDQARSNRAKFIYRYDIL